ncbi:16S rRNA (guanine(966)-N(2))-methyltransferase RsmD [Streptococcus tangpeifui]|uniref:16S rRNA (guanine(966)-N(2))-methyltransferase RsmD n=1 Tax=Streptococcus tangpeifui TaxID=2709400 RepID=UPI0013E9CA64|nr:MULTISPECIES: 16S rRNA (guanine(966)-N(2))-methyltransferase RsmD [unclassified Streptococcus]
MRIIAGNFGGRTLKTLEGQTTRPTSDKVRGAIYSMIGPFFDGGRVLDLYAGSGGLSIEAISRGMEQAVLVERDRRAQAVIEANIKMTNTQDQFQLIKRDAKQVLPTLRGQFDLVLLDPPYAKEEIVQTIQQLQDYDLLAPAAMIVCETDKAVVLPETINDLKIWKQKIYGISKVTIYVK